MSSFANGLPQPDVLGRGTMMIDTYLQRDADGKLWRIEVYDDHGRVKVIDIMSPTGCYRWELPERVGIRRRS